ncbi:unnamed protein product [Darwinula stevensoni]|uniref:C2H2-type domain-containing protein n=1 Tax=Darwinula stevensoni TaxID=69355 RepID=A0A7R9ACV4_9CRUS|nr:unnamed protein product [Darwinula stevensoni]CAG0900707.1 unnamed protein product [Darwinula stevensoni]
MDQGQKLKSVNRILMPLLPAVNLIPAKGSLNGENVALSMANSSFLPRKAQGTMNFATVGNVASILSTEIPTTIIRPPVVSAQNQVDFGNPGSTFMISLPKGTTCNTNASKPKMFNAASESSSGPLLPGCDEVDLFQCGKCKKQFFNLSDFMLHKKACRGILGLERMNKSSIDFQEEQYSSQTGGPCGQSSPDSEFAVDASNQVPEDELIYSSTEDGAQVSQHLVLTETDIQALNLDIDSAALMNGSVETTFTIAPDGTVSIRAPPVMPIMMLNEGFLEVAAGVGAGSLTANSNSCQIGSRSDLISSVTVLQDDKGFDESSDQSTHSNHGNVDRKKFQCPVCQKSFSKNFDVKQHLRTHTGDKPFQCVVCGRAFAQKSNVKKHMASHKVWPNTLRKTLPVQPIRKIKMPLPQGTTNNSPVVRFRTVETVAPGLRVTSEEKDNGVVHVIVDNSYICQFCQSNFASYNEMKKHMQIHAKDKVYCCIQKDCKHTTSNLEEFLNHVHGHKENMEYHCHDCGEVFTSLSQLGLHQRNEHPPKLPSSDEKTVPNVFTCQKCPAKYATAEALKSHMVTESHHHPCINCQKVFSCERLLRRHLQIHSTMNRFKCTVCDKSFKRLHYLRVHEVIHKPDKPFKCSDCCASFSRKDRLKRHETIHEKVARFKCPFQSHTGCKKEFRRPDKLKAHILTHSSSKPFRCKSCDKTFAKRVTLRTHTKLVHIKSGVTSQDTSVPRDSAEKEDKIFCCPSCHKGFGNKVHLAVHVCSKKPKEEKDLEEVQVDESSSDS